MTFEPHFDRDLKRGEVGEDTHNAFLIGKHEVKTDYRTRDTGNFYIETWQYNERGKWQSGINITESEFWVQASCEGLGGLYFPTEVLREILRAKEYPETRQPIYGANTNASIGRLVPRDDVLRKLGYLK